LPVIHEPSHAEQLEAAVWHLSHSPSDLGRRMSEGVLNLVDHVCPMSLSDSSCVKRCRTSRCSCLAADGVYFRRHEPCCGSEPL
jgi:hypothetical protein